MRTQELAALSERKRPRMPSTNTHKIKGRWVSVGRSLSESEGVNLLNPGQSRECLCRCRLSETDRRMQRATSRLRAPELHKFDLAHHGHLRDDWIRWEVL